MRITTVTKNRGIRKNSTTRILFRAVRVCARAVSGSSPFIPRHGPGKFNSNKNLEAGYNVLCVEPK